MKKDQVTYKKKKSIVKKLHNSYDLYSNIMTHKILRYLNTKKCESRTL